MRAGYGEKTREFLSTQMTPDILIDFAGIKVFENATVDTNILLVTSPKQLMHNGSVRLYLVKMPRWMT